MNKAECNKLVDSYIAWLKSGLAVDSFNGVGEITTPFLDRHNDHLQIYVVEDSGKFLVSDDGYIISDLATSGMEFSSAKRKMVLETALNGFGVKIKDQELIVEASKDNIGRKIHSLVQAMISVNDMFVLAKPKVESFFLEDVSSFLLESSVRFSPRVKLAGKSGYDHSIDFLIPASPDKPERLVQAINSPNKNTIGSYLFTLDDTRSARSGDSEAYAFLNDADRIIPTDVLEALKNYNVIAAPWSKKADFVDVLAA